MRCERLKAFRLERFLLVIVAGLAFVACDGGGNRESVDDEIEGPTSAATFADATATPLPTVSPEELSAIDGDPPRESGTDPCSLVTKAEVEEIIEQQVVDVWRDAHFWFGGSYVCEYFSNGDPFGSATIRLESGLAEDEFEEEIDEMNAEIEAGLDVPKARAISGIAEAAYSFGPVLWVYQEGTMLAVTVIVKNDPDLGAAKELASIALRRLP
jgi:hypothetical protein